MVNVRLSMRKVREILRLSWHCKVSQERTRVACGVSKSTVWEILNRARQAGFSNWEDVEALSEQELEERLYPPNEVESPYPLPDWKAIHLRLRTEKHVTRLLLWEEYRLENGGVGFGFSQFCELYRSWARSLSLVMRQEHRAGEKVFVDFAGDTIPFWNKLRGEVCQAHIFVAVLGASNYTFARATEDETRVSWLECHTSAFEFFGGVPELIIPDNPKALVNKSCLYDPEVNPAYTDLARHYGTAVLPARPRKPRDKAKVEAGVLLAERWILARLRKMTFFSIAEVNEAIAKLLIRLNEKPFQKLEGCRKTLFESLERQVLRPLPEERFEVADWRQARVSIDYHIEFDRHYYSVPFKYAREKVEVRFTSTTVEIFLKGVRIAVHKRSSLRGQHTTLLEHMPQAHREYAQWSPERILRWAEKIGTETHAFITALIGSRDHPAQGFRAALGILRLADHYGADALERACQKGNSVRSYRFAYIRDLLRGKRPFLKQERKASNASQVWHENIRGPRAFRSDDAQEHERAFLEASKPNKEDLC